MKARARYVLTQLLALLLAVSFSLAPENNATAQDGPAFTQQELDQMLAPIALYPDSLLSQILMAATYPLEVVEAARWSRANPGLKGDRGGAGGRAEQLGSQRQIAGRISADPQDDGRQAGLDGAARRCVSRSSSRR